MNSINKHIDTADIFEYKFNQLDQEMESQIEKIKKKINQLEKENKVLKGSTLLKGSGSFISMILGYVFGIGLGVLGIGLIIAEGQVVKTDDWIVAFIMSLPGLIWGLIYNFKYSKLKNEKLDALEKVEENEREVERLRKKLTLIPQKFNELKQAEYKKLDAHMLNEELLRDADNVAISESKEQMKECPRCAELIKYKATYCRYCQSEIN